MRPAHPLPRGTRAAAAVLLVLTTAACASDRATAPAATPFDVAQVAGGIGAVGAATSAALGGRGGLALPSAELGGLAGPGAAAFGACTWDASAQAFGCAPYRADGLTVTVAYAPLDARGAVQRVPDRATTAALRTVTTTVGTFTIPATGGTAGGSYTVDARQEATVRGLLVGPRVVDGVVTMATRAALGATTVRMQLRQTIAGVVLPEGSARWPSAGVVTTDLLDPDGGALVARQVLTFDGTSTVALVTTAAGTTQRCALDLAAATAPRCTVD